MKIRCDVHLNNAVSKVILVARPEETADHLALKLAGYVMFLALSPIVESSSEHPSLQGHEHKPDVMALDEAGDIILWLECGAVSVNKLDKISKRLHQTRIVVLKKSEREAQQLRERLESEIRHHDRVEIWTWAESHYQEWLNALEEKTEIFGEASERSFNVVVNNTPFCADLLTI